MKTIEELDAACEGLHLGLNIQAQDLRVLKQRVRSLFAAVSKPAVTPEWVRDGIADFVGDNWPDRKHSLAEIEIGIRSIEINPPKTAASSMTPTVDATPAPG